MRQEYLGICRCLVAAFACCGGFLFLGLLVYKFEAGFYGPNEMPIPVRDGPHIRARRSFYQCMGLVLLAVSLLGLVTCQIVSPDFWSLFGTPSLVGVYFSMLCAWGFYGDLVRPRQSHALSWHEFLRRIVWMQHR